MPPIVIVLVFMAASLLMSIHMTRDNDIEYLQRILVREVEKTNMVINASLIN